MHREVLEKTGLKLRLYDCRHTFATRAVKSRIDLLTLAYLLGDFGLNEVTRYADIGEDGSAKAVRQMEKSKTKAV